MSKLVGAVFCPNCTSPRKFGYRYSSLLRANMKLSALFLIEQRFNCKSKEGSESKKFMDLSCVIRFQHMHGDCL
uniref:Uncharacterized protein n=1 Tax=Physcomitrium patens TaxID=3218 RepID=A0A2K1KJD6_PHYPA|nr:hypothetical protein PHYPA_007564 [Physcomitrium patens]